MTCKIQTWINLFLILAFSSLVVYGIYFDHSTSKQTFKDAFYTGSLYTLLCVQDAWKDATKSGKNSINMKVLADRAWERYHEEIGKKGGDNLDL